MVEFSFIIQALGAEGVDPYNTTVKKAWASYISAAGTSGLVKNILCIIIGPYIELVFCMEHH